MPTANGTITGDLSFRRNAGTITLNPTGLIVIGAEDGNENDSNEASETRGYAVRFTLPVPKNATINSAVLTLKSGNTPDAATGVAAVRAAAADNQAMPADAAAFNALPLTEGSATVTVGNTDATFTASYVTAIQALVNRSGWVSGNGVLLLFEPSAPQSVFSTAPVGLLKGINYPSSGFNATLVVDYTLTSPPTVSGPATATVREGLAVNTTQLPSIVASETPTSYAATGGPAGVTLNTSTGVFGGTPDPGSAGEYQVILNATNANGESEDFVLTLTVEDNTAPAIATPPGSAFEYQFETSYSPIAGESDPTWSATGVPAGLTLSSSGLLSGDLPAAGTYDIEVTCTAATGATDTKTYRLVVQTSPPAGGAIRMSLLGVG